MFSADSGFNSDSFFVGRGLMCYAAETCLNRVVQNAIKDDSEIGGSGGSVAPALKDALMLFRTANSGWAVRTQLSIPARTFVVEYCGEWISAEEARKRDSKPGYNEHGFLWTESTSLFVATNSKRVRFFLCRSGDDDHCITVDATRYSNIARFVRSRFFVSF